MLNRELLILFIYLFCYIFFGFNYYFAIFRTHSKSLTHLCPGPADQQHGTNRELLSLYVIHLSSFYPPGCWVIGTLLGFNPQYLVFDSSFLIYLGHVCMGRACTPWETSPDPHQQKTKKKSLIVILTNADWTERRRIGSVQRFQWKFFSMDFWDLAQESAIDMVQGNRFN